MPPPAPAPAAVRIVGRGRAGGALAGALTAVGWDVEVVPGRDATTADGVDLVVLAVPDDAVAEVAAAVGPGSAVVAHLSGSRGLDVLGPHARPASIHPLVALPTAALGAERLRAGAWFAVAGDAIAGRVVRALGGRAVEVPDEHRAAYHAAACIASNHLVALLGQVERVAAPIGVPLEAYLDLARATVDNVAALGPAAALTGPAARGDTATLDRHRAALDPAERAAYEALVHEARRLAGRV
ncbi:DUF2520 domain-containing protein [Iamia sp. SCSIO 61187]|uniref:DUF2520 domain-containing protein n=1 Tax=Iamia sp. SCSIO 61187 TaxID=2722752 RepID=UPI001C624979|nr:DUF2520 domain-containing protein [Iamia sp. SCSIO 61187]QYG94620.1 DUF2520 domain-containing protein [Iamia sp. SCSIO 61187]